MEYVPYPDFYMLDDNEVEINSLMCPKCGRTAEDMYDECDTVLHCPCGKYFYHVI